MRSNIRKCLVVPAAVLLWLGFAPASNADLPVAQGWWWVAQNSGLNLGSGVGPAGVPERGLYVASNSLSEEAVAALRFAIPDGGKATALTLTLAGSPTGTPDVALCAVTSQWAPAQQGAWDERPEVICADAPPIGVVSADGATMSFDVSSLPLSGAVDFALVPAVDPDSGGRSNFQVAFEQPGIDTLTVTQPSSGGTTATTFAPPTTQQTATQPPPSQSSATVATLPATPPQSSGFNLTPSTSPPVTASTTGGQLDFSAPPLANPSTQPVAAIPAPSGTNLRVVGIAGLAALAAFYAWLSGQEGRAPRSLLEFGRDGDHQPVIDTEAMS